VTTVNEEQDKMVFRRRNQEYARMISVIALLCACALSAAAQRRATYTNPTLGGDYPDPSVIRTGRDYWATATSSDWAPEFPLLHSRDLINWELTGAVFHKRPDWSDGNYWAPEISRHRGRFFIYYVGHKKKDGPLCVAVATARRPQGPYTDHGPLVCQPVGSIDGFAVTDERGQRYLLWKEDGNSVSKPTPIWAQPLSADGTRLIGERRELIRNTESWEKHPTLPYGDLVEGPAVVVRRGGWFYMFYSGNFCCGRECMYMMGVARARKLLGPWEKNPKNPILAGNDAWKCPGHGTIVTDAHGRDYLLYHAYHAKDFVYVGRQGLLDEVKWGADGWPTINDGKGPSAQAVAPEGQGTRGDLLSFRDDFRMRLSQGWQWPQANEPVVRFERRGKDGWLVLSPQSDHAADVLGAVLARQIRAGDYVAETTLDARNLRPGMTAGLSAYGDAENALGLAFNNGKVIVWRREKNQHSVVSSTDAPASANLRLRMTAREGHLYRFALSDDGRNWKEVGDELEGSYLPPWDRGVRVALTAGGAQRTAARFDRLDIRYPR
jgi:xylan 1,4-beta-xylosidase